jgi:dienelactone hydrolase
LLDVQVAQQLKLRAGVCFELDSLPPVPAISGAAVSHDDLVLEARDGNRFPAFTPEHNAAFEQALSDASVEHELVVYEGAPHSFFDRKQAEFAEASGDAWSRVLAFLEQHAR